MCSEPTTYRQPNGFCFCFINIKLLSSCCLKCVYDWHLPPLAWNCSRSYYDCSLCKTHSTRSCFSIRFAAAKGFSPRSVVFAAMLWGWTALCFCRGKQGVVSCDASCSLAFQQSGAVMRPPFVAGFRFTAVLVPEPGTFILCCHRQAWCLFATAPDSLQKRKDRIPAADSCGWMLLNSNWGIHYCKNSGNALRDQAA